MADKDHPITFNTVAKWAGIIGTVATAIMSAVWFAASVKSDISALRADGAAMQREWAIRNEQQDREITSLKSRADGSEKTLAEMQRKLDVAVAILERLEKKISPGG